jgi:PAS domain S-box-containing protein
MCTSGSCCGAAVAQRSLELADLYDHAPCGYLDLGPDGTILRINATLLGWLGCSHEAVVGRHRIAEFFTDEGRAAFAREMPDFVHTGVFLGLDADVVDANGRSRRVRLEANAMRDDRGEFLMSRTVIYDVSEAHALRLRMLAVLDEQYAMLENDLVGIARLRGGQIVWANRAVHRVFGYAYGELIGTPVALLYPEADVQVDVVGTAMAAMGAAGHCRLQVQMRHQCGKLLWIDLSGSQLEAGVPGGAEADGHTLWMMADITELQEHRLLSEHQARHDRKRSANDTLAAPIAVC